MDFIYFRTDDNLAREQAAKFLPEGRQYQIDKKWSVRVDNAHVQGTQRHYHVQLKGTDVAAINQDGTPSHNSDPSVVPNWIYGWVKDKKLMEQIEEDDRVPDDVIAEAIRHEELVHRAAEIGRRGQ